MTATCRYHCNLCHADIHDANSEGKNPGVGVYFCTRDEFRFRLCGDAENHLCDRCINAIVAECQEGFRIEEVRTEKANLKLCADLETNHD